MKTMTCNQLGGACNQTFSAETFDEIADLYVTLTQNKLDNFSETARRLELDRRHPRVTQDLSDLLPTRQVHR